MCLIVFDWQPGQPRWLTLAANRDEFWQRPARPLHRWQDDADIIAGRDLEQGGTWLGITGQGRFAALTNIRAPGAGPQNPRSRGHLVADYLRATSHPEQWAATLRQSAADYAPFNLLAGDRHSLIYISNYPQLRCETVTPGVHSLSNAWLDTPWPKSRLAEQQLQHWLREPAEQTLPSLLSRRQPFADEQLPSTGVPAEWERMLSAQFIVSPAYGTRCSTALTGTAGQLTVHEISWQPDGSGNNTEKHDVVLI
ncbi:MAG: NRDE family protein [Pseudomonadota bacterium]|nr:NRDE family protein [Pseudomonadota bacterium]